MYPKKHLSLMVILPLISSFSLSFLANNYQILPFSLVIIGLVQLAMIFMLGRNKLQSPALETPDYELGRLQKGLEQYKDLARSAYKYGGTYPVWKVQQEFRQLMLDAGTPISSPEKRMDHVHLSKAEQIDQYLSRIIDAFSTQINSGIDMDFVHDKDFWSLDELPEARGEQYLK